MNAKNMNITITEGVSVNDTLPDTPKMTKVELQCKSDEEILEMVKKAQGHTGTDFQDYMNCDFSYTYLTGVLQKRGYENGWHKIRENEVQSNQPEIIQMCKSESVTCRQSFIIEKEIAEEWKDFNKNIPFKSVTIGFALKRFMTDVRNGLIKFELKI